MAAAQGGSTLNVQPAWPCMSAELRAPKETWREAAE